MSGETIGWRNSETICPTAVLTLYSSGSRPGASGIGVEVELSPKPT
jgi:hypothetical protein